MSWLSLAVTLSLGLLTVRSSASEDVAEWLSPVAGILRVYNSDLLLSEIPRRNPPLSLLEELGSDAVADDDDPAFIHQHAVASGTGVGSWSGKTGAQITFAGATAAAANKVAASVASSNALSVATSNARVVDRSATQGKAIGAGKVNTKNPLAVIGWFAWIRMFMSTGFVVKSLCMMCNICYQASPLPLITDYRVKGDTGDADLAPFIATAYGGWQWCFYGLFAYIVTNKSGFLVLVYSNFVGATLGLYYVYAFNQNCHDKAMIGKRGIYYTVLVVIVTVQFIAIMSLAPVKALFFCGLISSAWSTIASASLVATVPKVFETRNSKSLPLPLLVMGTVSATLWIVCGVMLWDPWITFPNMFALCVCIFALYLCYIFPPDGCCEEKGIYECDYSAEDYNTMPRGLDVERPSPLQRALGLVSGSSVSGDAKESSMFGGTGGTGDSF